MVVIYTSLARCFRALDRSLHCASALHHAAKLCEAGGAATSHMRAGVLALLPDAQYGAQHGAQHGGCDDKAGAVPGANASSPSPCAAAEHAAAAHPSTSYHSTRPSVHAALKMRAAPSLLERAANAPKPPPPPAPAARPAPALKHEQHHHRHQQRQRAATALGAARVPISDAARGAVGGGPPAPQGTRQPRFMRPA